MNLGIGKIVDVRKEREVGGVSIKFQSEALQHFPLAVNKLPSGWQCVVLDDIASTVSLGFSSGKHSSNGSGIPLASNERGPRRQY